ncbi:MAG: pyruvate kinase [Pseudomonadales bacterium]
MSNRTGEERWILSPEAERGPRGSKVVATVGPATDAILPELLRSGVNVCRVNFSHGTAAEHRDRVRAIRAAAAEIGRVVAILGDLQGPKIRIGQFASEPVQLEQGAAFTIDTALDQGAGTVSQVGTTYQDLPGDCHPGDLLVLGDGLIELKVERAEGTCVHCTVALGGPLTGGKGINKRGGGLSAGALTPKDHQDIALAAELGVDFLAVSFPRNADDMHAARALARDAGLHCSLVAKLERAEAVRDPETLHDLISASDVIMIARGDLGIEIDYSALMGVQKYVIAKAREMGRATITATQMMESMIKNPVPTRAEVLDVANAVLDGTDAVMLSGETAVGDYPVATVQAAVRVIRGAEASAEFQSGAIDDAVCEDIDESIAMAVMSVAARLERVKAIICFSASGNTPKLLSRFLSRIPIYALVEDPKTLARIALYRGVNPVLYQPRVKEYEAMNDDAINWLIDRRFVSSGDRVILAKGDLHDERRSGGTNTLKVIRID